MADERGKKVSFAAAFAGLQPPQKVFFFFAKYKILIASSHLQSTKKIKVHNLL